MNSPAPARRPAVTVIIPALNEEHSIAKVIGEIPKGLADSVLVADNGSTDRTAEIAAGLGATVAREPRRGYGRACLAALRQLPPEAEIIVFLDGDASDYPEEMTSLVRPIAEDDADLVIGSRLAGVREAGAMLPHQVLANRLFTALIRVLFGHRFTDLGPFRAIRRECLEDLKMRDTNYGWTAEMQVKALKAGLRVKEVPVRYRKRRGRSKISGRVLPSLAAGAKITWTILKLYFAK